MNKLEISNSQIQEEITKYQVNELEDMQLLNKIYFNEEEEEND